MQICNERKSCQRLLIKCKVIQKDFINQIWVYSQFIESNLCLMWVIGLIIIGRVNINYCDCLSVTGTKKKKRGKNSGKPVPVVLKTLAWCKDILVAASKWETFHIIRKSLGCIWHDQSRYISNFHLQFFQVTRCLIRTTSWKRATLISFTKIFELAEFFTLILNIPTKDII